MLLLSAACTVDAVVLPEGYNALTNKPIAVDGSVEKGAVRGLGGVQGGPKETISGDDNLYEEFQLGAIDLLRLPDGYLCDYTLPGIFPNKTQSPSDPAHYEFEAIDAVLNDASLLPNVKPADGGELGRVRLSFQAMFDIGLDTCVVGADGTQTGQPIADIGRWTSVVIGALKHFNKSLLTENDPFAEDARDFRVRHVEFLPDPLGRGGYPSVDALVPHFISFAEAVRATFPVVGDEPTIRIVGPAFRVTSESEVDSTIGAFLDGLTSAGKNSLLDVVSFELAADSPSKVLAVASRVRTVATAKAPNAKVWLSRLEPSAGLVDPLPTTEPPDKARKARSNVVGAFAVGSRIALQDVVDELVLWRGDRRSVSLSGSSGESEEGALWRKNGEELPGGLAYKAFGYLNSPTQVRLETGKTEGDDAKSLWTIVTKETGTDCGNDELTCTRLRVVVANSRNDGVSSQAEYQLTIAGLAEFGAESRNVTVRRYPIEADTRSLDALSDEQAQLVNGTLYFRFSSGIPGTDYLEISLGTPP